jgi:hypothetical protein
MSDTLDVLRVLQVVIIILSLVVIYYATKGFRKTRSRSMLSLALGFFLISVGAISAGFLFELLHFDLTFVDVVEATFQVAGFLLIVYSILGAKD